MPKKPERGLIPLEIIERRIYLIRDQKVMVDFDLAELYQAPTRASIKQSAETSPASRTILCFSSLRGSSHIGSHKL